MTMIDLDGTLAGYSEWTTFWKNTKGLFQTGLLMNPPNSSWSILTARPKIDYWIIKLFCQRHNLFPERIITSQSLFYSFQNKQQIASWKMSVINGIISKNLFIERVIYVDADTDFISKMMISGKQVIVCSPDALTHIVEDYD